MFLFKKNYETIDINELKNLDAPNIIDIRTKEECSIGKIKGSKNIEMNDLLSNPKKYLNNDEKYYLYCATGARSKMTCVKLASLGYKVIDSGGYFKYKK
ncbi:rhodanese-related sulfurtransferase [Bacilli bacterium PM5-3]|nr:rhodanese-related sulfurtransferase [Bacilli bacterium PM5-3]MDH6603196.1 rhodanese-related sulfurtransferase [Bacilli bacterium PM5-9]